ncbi:MAG TPA: oligosaccharyl transferase, archaeosortase A system-associated [Candidatus Thermoplasmatota archaeon]|nr:oligosaccharyl transferase, archaeosortase A system-associated [Candidatus Thermoplasmatota archaeon]
MATTSPSREAAAPTAGRRLLLLGLKYVEYPLVALFVALNLWIRFANYDAVIARDPIYFPDTDPYYHLRAVVWSLHNFPLGLSFDPMTQYPYGTHTGQFGTLFDQFIAFVILAFHGFSVPENEVIIRWLSIYPAVLGALIVVPVFYLAKRLAGSLAGYMAAFLFTVIPGGLLPRTVLAYPDHHVAEALLVVTSLLALAAALEAGRESGFLVTDRRTWTRERLLKPAVLAFLAALALWAYLDVWPPGVLVVVVAAIVLGVQAILDHVTGRRIDGLAGVAALTFLLLSLILFAKQEADGWHVSILSSLQPLLAFAVAAEAAALLGLALFWRTRDFAPWTFPAALLGAVVLGILLLYLVFPGAYASAMGAYNWVFGGVSRTTRTISEVRPSCSAAENFPNCGVFRGSFGRLHITALLATIGLAAMYAWRRRPALGLFLMWAILIWFAATNQVRFLYYLALVVAIANGLLVGWAAMALDVPGRVRRALGGTAAVAPEAPTRRGKRTAAAAPAAGGSTAVRVAGVAVVALLLLTVAYDEVLVSSRADNRACAQGVPVEIPAWTYVACERNGGEVVMWSGALEWLRDRTPPMGLDLNSRYVVPQNAGERYPYPEGTYGVLSWWDYGHWIEIIGERIPVANPFQQQAPFAAVYLTAQSEAKAEQLLQNLTGPDHHVRYVMIDDASAGGKFAAITTWANTHHRRLGGDYFPNFGAQNSAENPVYREVTRQHAMGGARTVVDYTPLFRDTMMWRLYHDDAEGLGHYRLVWEYPHFTLFASVARQEGNQYRTEALHDQLAGFNVTSGVAFLESDIYAAGRDGLIPGSTVFSPSDSLARADLYDLRLSSQLKIFEHVPGALLTGTAAPGARVTASVDLHSNVTGRDFTYTNSVTAGPDGSYQLRVPYSTTAYVPLSEGGTALEVIALGPYRVQAGSGTTTVQVPDAAVLRGLTVPVG